MGKKLDPRVALAQLKELGFNVPEVMPDLLEVALAEKEGTVQIWKCKRKKCTKVYRSPTKAVYLGCPCGSQMRLLWEKREK